MDNQPVSVYRETKVPMYIAVSVFLVAFLVWVFLDPEQSTLNNPALLHQGFESIMGIFLVMYLGVSLYRPAKISLFENHLEFKKGKQFLSLPWNEVVGIHRDAVFALGPIAYYLARRFYMGGTFIETKTGFTKYFTSQLLRKNGSSVFKPQWKDFLAEFTNLSGISLSVGTVSVIKQKSKLFDTIFIIVAVLLAPVIIIVIYGLITGTLADSLGLLKDLGLLFIGQG